MLQATAEELSAAAAAHTAEERRVIALKSSPVGRAVLSEEQSSCWREQHAQRLEDGRRRDRQVALDFHSQQIALHLRLAIENEMICEVLRDASLGTHLECVAWPAVLEAATPCEQHEWHMKGLRIRWDSERERRRMGLT